MNELRLVVPMVPPSGNHYKTYQIITPRGGGKPFVQWYLTPAAKAWYQMVAAVNAGRKLRGPSLEVHFIVYLPTRRKTDADNFSKCIFDSLTDSGAIEDDKLVDDFHGHRRYDPTNPRTVIIVKTAQDQMFVKE